MAMNKTIFKLSSKGMAFWESKYEAVVVFLTAFHTDFFQRRMSRGSLDANINDLRIGSSVT